jgi:hypothetical protein
MGIEIELVQGGYSLAKEPLSYGIFKEIEIECGKYAMGKSLSASTLGKYAGILGIGGVGFATLGPLIVAIMALGGLVWYLKFHEQPEA